MCREYGVRPSTVWFGDPLRAAFDSTVFAIGTEYRAEEYKKNSGEPCATPKDEMKSEISGWADQFPGGVIPTRRARGDG